MRRRDPPPPLLDPRADPASAFAAPAPALSIGPLHTIGGCTLRRARKRGLWCYQVVFRDKVVVRPTPKGALLAMRQEFPKEVDRPTGKPEVVGEIPAVRVWKLAGEFLVPVTHQDGVFFDGPILVAHEKPALDNSSGLYSLKPDKDFWSDLVQGYQADAWGDVGLLGTVVEHARGYRAEKQVVRRISLLVPSSPEFRRLLEARYQCEVLDAYGKPEPKKRRKA